MRIKKGFRDTSVRRALNKFFRQCAVEENQLHVKQGKLFDEKFGEHITRLTTLSMCSDRELDGAETVRFVRNLCRFGIDRDIVTLYLAQIIDFSEFLRLLGREVAEKSRQRVAKLADELSTYIDAVTNKDKSVN